MDSREWTRYWDREAERFDRIYSAGGRVKGLHNRLFRSDMDGRLRFALLHAHPESGPDILEIGCGTGVHTVAYLDGGASSVTGVDLSRQMLAIASGRLEARPVHEGRAVLIQGDFMAERLGSFDVVTAIGVFDYVEDPEAFMRKATRHATGSVIATFPRAGTFRACLRKLRLSINRCPVRFYTCDELHALAAACGARIAVHELIGQLHCVVIERSADGGGD
jgi:ubiquinone/menaquinone biosynthesis C-methylase UbiE